MFGWLEDIYHAIVELPIAMMNVIIDVINLFIEALAALAEVLIGLLPTFPEAPSAPGGVMGFILWVLPVPTLVAILMTFVGLWISFLALKAGLKWVKLL